MSVLPYVGPVSVSCVGEHRGFGFDFWERFNVVASDSEVRCAVCVCGA